MAPKKTKWIIGLSSVAAFTGFIGFLNGTTSTGASQQTAYNNQPNTNGQQSETPSSQNPFAQEDGSSSQLPSDGSSGSYTTPDGKSGSSDSSSGNSNSSGSSDSWAGDYQGDSDSSSSDSTLNGSSEDTTTTPDSGTNNFSGGSGFQAPPSNGSMAEGGDLRSHSS